MPMAAIPICARMNLAGMRSRIILYMPKTARPMNPMLVRVFVASALCGFVLVRRIHQIRLWEEGMRTCSNCARSLAVRWRLSAGSTVAGLEYPFVFLTSHQS